MTPTIIKDDFLRYPNKVLDLINKCEFKKDETGRWPGERSEALHNVDDNFFNWIHEKIFALLYPDYSNDIVFEAASYFQKVNGNLYDHQGWVHKDQSLMTIILYLSKHENCGTSLWQPKTFMKDAMNSDQKYGMYKGEIENKEGLPYLKENNDKFNKTLTINSKFNRLLIFDSQTYHSADNFKDANYEEDRLTFISFVYDFYNPKHGLKNGVLASQSL